MKTNPNIAASADRPGRGHKRPVTLSGVGGGLDNQRNRLSLTTSRVSETAPMIEKSEKEEKPMLCLECDHYHRRSFGNKACAKGLRFEDPHCPGFKQRVKRKTGRCSRFGREW